MEDEILRAAISKYGLNQWARVSSLLARKTAKQVKARWFEWLDPTIKKIEWSREEDEKLLHLAKLMPTQWRTIAPIVGRTATQCIERYQKLLDDAEQQDEEKKSLSLTGVGADASAPTGARKYRAGDIDPTPESKPARPDAIDMDEDEKEMLSEARARLANTQGKKAKRKDRERILEGSRRLALLQKRRELKMAGINTKLTRKKKGMVDYNADIPFEHKPAAGFYDIAEEQDINLRRKNAFDLKTHHKGVLMKESVDKDKKRNRDPEAAAASAEQSAQAKAERLFELNQADKIAKRRKLVLPAPQVNDEELEQIVKHGSRGDKTREKYLMDESVTGALVGDYNDTVLGEPIRTPQLERSEDRILQSVRDIHALANEQSSLLGNANTPLHDSSFSSQTILPSHHVVQTPNPLAMRTPGGPSTKGSFQTPRRDGLGVNKVDVGATPREVLRRGFQSLPKPLNNFEIVMPEDEEMNGSEREPKQHLVRDAGEEARELARLQEIEKQRELLRRSQVLQKDLPRPTDKIDSTLFVKFQSGPNTDNVHLEINQQIASEMSKLILSDNVKYPVFSEMTAVRSNIVSTLDDEIKAAVLRDINEELNKMANLEVINERFTSTLELKAHSLPGLDIYNEDNDTSDDKEKSNLSVQVIKHLSDVATKANKVEHKLGLTLGGYSKRQGLLVKKMGEAFSALEELRKNRAMFEDLKEMEAVAISSRLNELQEEVNFLADAERVGQERYRELQSALA